jgi:hypothetical protein
MGTPRRAGPPYGLPAQAHPNRANRALALTGQRNPEGDIPTSRNKGTFLCSVDIGTFAFLIVFAIALAYVRTLNREAQE